MRVALLLIVVAACSSQKAAEPRVEETVAVPAAPPPAASAPAPEPTVGAAPPSGGGAALDTQQAREAARAQGVLGPTDRAAFDVRGTVMIKSANPDVTKTVETKRDALQACYDKALAFDENLAGELVIHLEAGKVSIARSTLKHATLEKCVVETLGAAALPKPGKAAVTLAFKRD